MSFQADEKRIDNVCNEECSNRHRRAQREEKTDKRGRGANKANRKWKEHNSIGFIMPGPATRDPDVRDGIVKLIGPKKGGSALDNPFRLRRIITINNLWAVHAPS